MAYDYDVDILAALWTGIEDTEEPYATFIADNPTLTNDTAEARILSTIELLRSHMELISSRTEAKLLHESIAKLIRHTAGGSNPFSTDATNPCATGNVKFPAFPAGGNFEVVIDGNVTEADSATGGDIDTVIAEVNVSLDALFPAAAEVTTVFNTGADVDGDKGGQYFTLNSVNDNTEFYVWYSHAGAAEVTDFTFNNADVEGDQGSKYFLLDSAGGTEYYAWLSHSGQAEVTNVNFNTADVDGNQGGNRFTLDSAENATEYYAWLSHPGQAEVTDVNFTASDVAGNQGGKYFFLDSAEDATEYYCWLSHSGQAEVTDVDFTATGADVAGSKGGLSFTLDSPSTEYYAWLSHPGLAHVTTVVFTLNDTGGNQGGKSFSFESAENATEYYAWLSHPGLPELSSVTAVADVLGSLGGTHFTLDSAEDATEYYCWIDHAATAGIADATNGSLLGAATTGAATDTYDFDVTIDGGGLQALTVSVTMGDTYSAIATAMSGAVAGGTVAYVDAAFAFRVTSSTTGSSSDATIAVGTFGSGGGDLFAALDAAETVTHTFSATPGLDAPADPAPGGLTGITATISVDDGASTVATAVRTAIDGVGDFDAEAGGNPFTVTNFASGATTDFGTDTNDTGFTITTTQQGIDAAADPGGTGTGIACIYAVGDTTSEGIAAGARTAIGGNSDFNTSGASSTCIITNDAVGSTAATADVDTSATFEATVTGIDAAADPVGVGTSLPIVYAVGDSASAIGGAARTSIGLNVEFGTAGATTECVITNVAAGAAPDAEDVDTGATISTTIQGIDAATDPTPGVTGLAIVYSIDVEAEDLGSAARSSIGANSDFNTSGAGTECVITNDVIGTTTNAENFNIPGTVSTTTQGVDAAVDPAAEGTAIPIVYAVGDSTGAIAIAARLAIGGLGDFGTSGIESECIITNAAIGATTDFADIDTEATIETSQQGADPAVDPVPGGTGIPILYSTNDATTEIAPACITAIDGVGDFGAAGGGSTCTVTNAAIGDTVDATDFNTEASVTVSTQGADVAVDPAPAGLTSITAAITINDSAAELDDAIRIAVGALGEFGASETAPVTITNAETGPTTDAADVTTEATITVTTQGTDPFGDAVDVTARRTADGLLQICAQFDNTPSSTPTATSFTLVDAGGGILGPAGIITGANKSAIKIVADNGRNLALGNFKGFKRGPNLG